MCGHGLQRTSSCSQFSLSTFTLALEIKVRSPSKYFTYLLNHLADLFCLAGDWVLLYIAHIDLEQSIHVKAPTS